MTCVNCDATARSMKDVMPSRHFKLPNIDLFLRL